MVKGGTLLQLQRHLGKKKITVKDFENESIHKGVTINSMYLDIIAQFSKFTCVVYVQGLTRVEDALLKWLAEYTFHHPWRFVFFENIDASWNFSENRDRCNFTFAPETPATLIQNISDLTSGRISKIRRGLSLTLVREVLFEDNQDPFDCHKCRPILSNS